jgi:DUF4097 and DUF4098 domain-containing protein YvlB
MKRRSSVIGPLILIAIGTLFLMKNMRPDMPVVDFLARTWPFLLIAWGGLRLVEIGWWFTRGQPLPVNGLSGGEWFLVVLLSVFGSGLYVAGNRSDWLSNAHVTLNGIDLFNDAFEFPIAGKQVAVGKATRLIVENFRGDAQITGAEVTEVRLTGKKKIRTGQQSEANRLDEETPVELIVQGDQVVVRCNQKTNSRITDMLEIVVPKTLAIEARGRYGDFDIRDTTGAVDVRSENAGVRLDNLAGPVTVYTRKSDIIRAIGLKNSLDLSGGGADVELDTILGQVRINGSYSGTIQLRALSKPVHVEGQQLEFRADAIPGEVRSSLSDFTGSNLTGPVKVSSQRSRDVRLTGFTQTVDVTLRNGSVTLEPGQKNLSQINVQLHHGDVELDLPPQSSFRLNADTSRGAINTDEWGEGPRVSADSRHASLAYTSGQPGPDLTVHTDHGNVTLRKAGLATGTAIAPLKAPEPPPVPLSAAPPKVRVE